MSDKSSEEKTEEASTQKLKKARERGEIARSQNFAMVVATIGGFSALWLSIEHIGKWQAEFMRFILDTEALEPAHALAVARDVIVKASMPVFMGAMISAIFGNFFTNRGFTLSMEKIKPKIQNLGVSSYIQRTFSMQGFSNIVQITLVFVLLFLLMFLIIFLFRRDFFKIFQCGLNCGFDFMLFIFAVFMFTGLAITFAFALVDIKIQDFIYMKQKRSTKTEAKKELKEELGEPHIRQERKRLHEAAVTGETLEDMVDRASFVVHHRGMLAAAIAYANQQGRNQFVLVDSARALKAERMMAIAGQRNKLLLDASEDVLSALLGLEENAEIKDSRLLVELSKAILNASRG